MKPNCASYKGNMKPLTCIRSTRFTPDSHDLYIFIRGVLLDDESEIPPTWEIGRPEQERADLVSWM